MKNKIQLADEQWRERLTEDEFHVCREAGTERPFTGKYHDHHENGVYHCTCCGEPLFDSNTKFESGTGWPSYYQPVTNNQLTLRQDNGLLMRRTEVLCGNCDAHLGHVFNDGPQPTGQRYCINSVSLTFKPRGTSD